MHYFFCDFLLRRQVILWLIISLKANHIRFYPPPLMLLEHGSFPKLGEAIPLFRPLCTSQCWAGPLTNSVPVSFMVKKEALREDPTPQPRRPGAIILL